MEPYIGEIKLFAGDFAPRGWFFCDGTLLNIHRYEALYSIIQNYYGGDGQINFAVPDLRGRAPVQPGQGQDLKSNYFLGQKGGKEEVIISEFQIPSHSHGVNAVAAQGALVQPTDAYPASSPSDPSTGTGVNIYSKATADVKMNPNTIAATGGGKPLNIVSPVLAINYIIAWEGIYPSRP
ncbi:MAG: phage tail protein [Sphingobacteriales bacterium]|nr:MAG: phage tail protein [Sphingobacteriales bacterium]